MNAKTALSALAAVLLLAACGNKGPLVMPQKPVPVEQELPPPPAEATPAQPAGAVDADPAAATPTDDGDG